MTPEDTADAREGDAPVFVPAAAAPTDLQLLLDLPDDGPDRLKQSALLAGSALRRPTRRKLRQVFWDTAEYSLGRAGLAIAMQTSGQRRTQLLRNIKARPIGGRILYQQDNVLPGDGLDLTRLALLPGADPALVTRLAAEMLVPVFALDFTRMIWALSSDAAGLSVTLEIGVIESAAGRSSFRQIALSAPSGPAQGIYDFAPLLLREMPVRLATHDPIQQGYRLVAGTDWWPAQHDAAAVLEPRMSLQAGILAIGRVLTAEFRIAMAALEASGAPERIHEARVTIRRLRSMLSVFRDALPVSLRRDLSRRLGNLGTMLGQARELDVFLAETLEPLTRASGERACLDSLSLAAQAQREIAVAAARRAAGGTDFTALSCRLAGWFDAGLWPEPPEPDAQGLLDQPILAFARKLLRKHHRKLVEAGDAVPDLQPAELHPLRIRAKILRYASEFMAPLFPGRQVKRYVAGLKSIQDSLGTLNDAVIAGGLLPQLTGRDAVIAARAAGLVTGWTAAEGARARRHFTAALASFGKTKGFWN